MAEFRIASAGRPLRGRVRVPADKSISHRAAILGALAEGKTRVENWLDSHTTEATLDCLRAFQVGIDREDGGALTVHGRGVHGLREPDGVLFCAGSGTTMRLLAGLCAGQEFFSVLDGTTALKRRPMGRVARPLRTMGATVLGRGDGALPPLAIRGGELSGIEHRMEVASAQVKSALLLAGLFAEGATTVREPGPSRDHSERMLRAFGARVEQDASGAGAGKGYATCVQPVEKLFSPGAVRVPGDVSSAAFFIVAALLVPGSELSIEGVGINPTRTGLLDVLGEMGGRIGFENAREESAEPVADLIVAPGDGLRAAEVWGEMVPRMIDEFPVFAVAATQAHGVTLVREAQELRVKESDRIAALAGELRKMGAQVEERADGFAIEGPTPLRGANVSAHGDHRLAMSLAVAGLIAQGETRVDGWECVEDSFPGFGEALARVREDLA